LALEETFGSTETRKAGLPDVHPTQRGQDLHGGKSHPVTKRRIVGVRVWQRGSRTKAFHRLHEVEGGTQNFAGLFHSDQSRMRHLAFGESRKDPRLPAHRLAPITIRRCGRTSQHVVPVVPREAQQDVLRPPGQALHNLNRAAA
jgi:hypothetical protein